MVGDISPSTYANDSSFEESSTPYTVSFDGALEDLNVTFVETSGLVEADTWTVLISACGATDPLPTGASATLTYQDGTSAVAQLTLDRGFEGTVSGSHDVYAVNQHFTVRDTGTEMQSITFRTLAVQPHGQTVVRATLWISTDRRRRRALHTTPRTGSWR